MKHPGSELRTVHHDYPDATQEQRRDIRARVWRFVFDCYANKKAS